MVVLAKNTNAQNALKGIQMVLLFILLTSTAHSAGQPNVNLEDPNHYLVQGRSLFARSVEQPEYITAASSTFTRLAVLLPGMASRALVYQGALRAIEGKHSFWPQVKLARVTEALDMMDSGLAARPNDIEALFVHANICYNLPFFFGRRTGAEAHYQRIIALLPDSWQQYDSGFIYDMIHYMNSNLPLNPDERSILLTISKKLKKEI